MCVGRVSETLRVAASLSLLRYSGDTTPCLARGHRGLDDPSVTLHESLVNDESVVILVVETTVSHISKTIVE